MILLCLVFLIDTKRFGYFDETKQNTQLWLMVLLKSKMRFLKMKKPYDKIEKTESMRVEIRSRKLVEETLKIADSPRTKNCAF